MFCLRNKKIVLILIFRPLDKDLYDLCSFVIQTVWCLQNGFVKSTPPRVFRLYPFNTLQVRYRHVEDVHEEEY